MVSVCLRNASCGRVIEVLGKEEDFSRRNEGRRVMRVRRERPCIRTWWITWVFAEASDEVLGCFEETSVGVEIDQMNFRKDLDGWRSGSAAGSVGDYWGVLGSLEVLTARVPPTQKE
jgi:hypothetical protein